MVTVLAIDPGCTRSGVAVVVDDKPVRLEAWKFKNKHCSQWLIRAHAAPLEMALTRHRPDLVVVEGQHYHRERSKGTPADIIKLAQVAGGLGGIVVALSTASLVIPLPEEWKGQTKKEINQARTLSHYGIAYKVGAGYCYPTGCSTVSTISGYGSLNQGDWKEVADALGLARYGTGLLRS